MHFDTGRVVSYKMSMKRGVFLVRDEHEVALVTQARVSRYWRHDLDADRRTRDEYRRTEGIPRLKRCVDVQRKLSGRVLPVADPTYRISLGEGFTPLIQATRLGTKLGLAQLYVKDEGLNPTGSFKARGLCMALSRARELGVQEVVIPSAGNAAGAMSAYAAAAGMKAHVFMPQDVPMPFQLECKAFGAPLIGCTDDDHCGSLDALLSGELFDLIVNDVTVLKADDKSASRSCL